MCSMQQLRKERTWNNFMNKLQNLSKARLQSIEISNRKFNEFCIDHYKKSRDEIIDYVKSLDNEEREDELLEVLQEWINHLGKTLTVSSIRVKLTDVNRYFKYHKVRVDTKEIEFPPELKEEPYAISLEEIQEIIKVAKWKKQGYYLALISTGTRPVEILGLRKKDIEWNFDFNCYTALIPAKLTKKKIARTIKFSREVNRYLKKMLHAVDSDDDLVFCKNKNLDDARSNEDAVFRAYCNKVGFTQKYETTGRPKINLYCFRAYFFTKALRLLGDDTAHAMIGHGAYLQQYQRRTLKEKIELWSELESEILVFDQTKNEQKIKKLRDANTKLTDQQITIEDQEKRLKKLEEMLYLERNFQREK